MIGWIDVATWGVLLPLAIAVWFAIGAGIYQLVRDAVDDLLYRRWARATKAEDRAERLEQDVFALKHDLELKDEQLRLLQAANRRCYGEIGRLKDPKNSRDALSEVNRWTKK